MENKMMIFMVLTGIVTVVGVVAIAIIETKRMEKEQQSTTSSISKKRSDKAKKES